MSNYSNESKIFFIVSSIILSKFFVDIAFEIDFELEDATHRSDKCLLPFQVTHS